MASLVAEHSSSAWASVGVAHGLSCSATSGIFLEQGLYPCLLHWQVDSLLLSHQGSPNRAFMKQNFLILIKVINLSFCKSYQCLIPDFRYSDSVGMGCKVSMEVLKVSLDDSDVHQNLGTTTLADQVAVLELTNCPKSTAVFHVTAYERLSS